MKEKYSCYEFEVKPNNDMMPDFYKPGTWVYVIKSSSNTYIHSPEWFDTEQEARFAAIGHIDLMENGGHL